VRNAEFTTALGQVLHRPTVLPVPGFAAKIALGEFAEDVLTGQNAVPKRLLDAGFTFTHRDLDTALRAELG
jgi:NAD dependent epimerase/dehydratase family enzyme